MTAHNYVDEVTKQPTCTEKGVRTYICPVCGDSYTEDIPMTAHTEVIDKAVAPTCTATGLTEGKHCSICGEVLIEQEALPTVSHNYVNGVCTMCGAELQPTEGLVFTLSDDGTYYSITDYTGTATEVYIPSVYKGRPVLSIGYEAFRNCDSLTSITIPDSVTSIGTAAFSDCGSLTSITIPDSVTSIGSSAFSDCDSLESITIPDSVTSTGYSAFFGCDSLEGVYITDIAAWCAIDFGDSYANPLCYAHNLYFNGELVTDLVIPDSVTSIGNYAFRSCDSLESITIPDGVTSIGNYAFAYCDSLESITVASGNPVYHSAGNCLIETESKTLIAGCKNSIIPTDGSVTSIGNDAFAYCDSFESITIPDSVTSIGNSAFSWCDSLTSIAIPDSVTSIGWYAFQNCGSLTSITIGNGVTSIGGGAFYYCSGLTSITIPDSVTSIGGRAFQYCYSLESITIPDSVTSIGDQAFSGCASLETVYYAGSEEDWRKIDIGAYNSDLIYAEIIFNYGN